MTLELLCTSFMVDDFACEIDWHTEVIEGGTLGPLVGFAAHAREYRGAA